MAMYMDEPQQSMDESPIKDYLQESRGSFELL